MLVGRSVSGDQHGSSLSSSETRPSLIFQSNLVNKAAELCLASHFFIHFVWNFWDDCVQLLRVGRLMIAYYFV